MKKYSGKPVYKKSTWQWQAQISFSFHSVDWSGLKNSFPLRDIYAAVLAIRFVSSHFGIHPNSVSVFRIWISSSFFLHFLLNNQQWIVHLKMRDSVIISSPPCYSNLNVFLSAIEDVMQDVHAALFHMLTRKKLSYALYCAYILS